MRARALYALLGVAAASGAAPAYGAPETVDRPAAARAVTAPDAFDPRWLTPYFAADPLRAAAAAWRAGDARAAAQRLELALKQTPHASPEREPARYLLALSRERLGDLAGAAALFEELAATYPMLAPYHRLRAARCHLRRGDATAARALAARVVETGPFAADVALIEIDALYGEKRWDELRQTTATYLEKFPGGARRAELRFRHGEALEALGKAEDAAASYRRLWALAPGDPFAARAAERLDVIAAALPADAAARVRTPQPADWLARGLAFADGQRHADAEAALSTVIKTPALDAAIACQARFELAQAIFRQRQRARAGPAYLDAERACRAAKNDDLTVRALYQAGRALLAAGDMAGALLRFRKIEEEFPRHTYADDARLRTAEAADDAGDAALATALLGKLPELYPEGDQAGEALWRLAFRAYRAGDHATAARWLDEAERRFPREEGYFTEGRTPYFRGRLHERRGDKRAAAQAYERALRQYPLSVYALFAIARLRTLDRPRADALVAELRAPLAHPPPWSFPSQPLFAAPAFRRAVELARLGLGAEAQHELSALDTTTPDARWITAILLDRGGLWSAAHRIPRHALRDHRLAYPAERGIAEWRLAFPRAFPDLIAKLAPESKVPTSLALAVMREESAFDPRIESFANALGLMQLLLPTARRYAPRAIEREDLFDPATNIACGTRYLGALLARYGGRAGLAIAAYNAGEAAVDRWLRERGDLPLDEFIEAIPFPETRGYTKRVLASYFTYAWLYDARAPIPDVAFGLRGLPVPPAAPAARKP